MIKQWHRYAAAKSHAAYLRQKGNFYRSEDGLWSETRTKKFLILIHYFTILEDKPVELAPLHLS